VTVSRGGKFTSVYVGYGLKKGDSCFNPTTPPPVCSEPNDQKEQPEPTPLNEPEAVPEPDSQAEGDEEDE